MKPNVKNVDSSLGPTFLPYLGERRVLARLRALEKADRPLKLLKPAQAIPVFLVAPATMDRICPPERGKCVDERALRAIYRRNLDEEQALGRRPDFLGDVAPWDPEAAKGRLEKVRLHDGVFEAMGVYLKGVHPRLGTGIPTIALCPERIEDWARGVRAPVDLATHTVYYHELGHALMDTGPHDPYGTTWGRVTEEALANWIAAQAFRDPAEKEWVTKLMAHQPLEYRAYRHLEGPLLSDWDFITPREELPRVRLAMWRDHKALGRDPAYFVQLADRLLERVAHWR
ncbi:hypothetical protein [Meiothermus cerbereus]|uniref:hypothetical protein n=1 Tax=Meiothermus cerbereus TaxID=65552 RepID=UPI003EE9323C